MIRNCCRGILGIVNPLLLALYIFLFYELVITPAVLDWSLYGVALTGILAGLLIWCIPRKTRLSTTVLAISFLLTLLAVENVKTYPSYKLLGALVFIFIVIFITGKLLSGIRFSRYLLVFITALILNFTVDLSQVRFWSEFSVKWQSPMLYPRYSTIDYFPIALADVDGDKALELITQENIQAAEEENKKIGKDYKILEPEHNYFAIYKWNGTTFEKLKPENYDTEKIKLSIPVDYQAFPFYKLIMKETSKGLKQEMIPLVDRKTLIEQALDFGRFPFQMLAFNQESLASSKDFFINSQVTASKDIGDVIPGSEKEIVEITDKLKVKTANQGFEPENIIGSIEMEQIPEIGQSEVILGDVDSDNLDEILLTSEVSRILKLSKTGQWEVLWSSPEVLDPKARFQKFRFEDFGPLGNDNAPQIIALSKSNVRQNPTRYMTGYRYENGALKQTWRVFSGLINLRAGDVDGDGQNELVGYMYRAHRIFILEKHNLPIVQSLYAITGGIIILGFAVQISQRRKSGVN